MRKTAAINREYPSFSDISDDSLLLNINNIADQNAGVYALYIPSTATSELVEVILYSEFNCVEVLSLLSLQHKVCDIS